jgi:hypothetical protein
MLLSIVMVISFVGVGHAGLTTIGTATYQGNDYNLIYMDDGPFGPVTWLDYTKSPDDWEYQIDWASGLGNQLTVTLDPGYTTSVDWGTGWRLPETDESQANLSGGFGYEGPDDSGYHDYRRGYNMVNSEMGYLHYEELGNKGYYATDGTSPQPGWDIYNTFDFDNLQISVGDTHWSGTEFSPDTGNAWTFAFRMGYQQENHNKNAHDYALAVRPGEVSAVPVPGAFWLLGSGLIGLVGLRRKK